MSKPPKIVIPGLNRGAGIPGGYMLGRRRGSKQGPAELLNLTQVRAIGIATTTDVTASTSLVQSIAHSETISLSRSVSASLSAISSSLSGAVSSTTSLSSAVSTVISGSISSVNSTDVRQSTSLSQISSSLSGDISTNVLQSTSLSQISSSLSAAISTTTSLSTAVSSVDGNQSASLSQTSSSLSNAISSTTSLSTAVAALLQGPGVTYDVGLLNSGGNLAVAVPAGSLNLKLFGDILLRPNGDGIIGFPSTDQVTFYSPVNGAYAFLDVTNAIAFQILSGSTSYVSADTLVFRDATTKTDMRLTLDSSGLNIPSGKVLRVNSVQVVTAQQAAIADDASGAVNQAKINTILSMMRVHGLIAT